MVVVIATLDPRCLAHVDRLCQTATGGATGANGATLAEFTLGADPHK